VDDAAPLTPPADALRLHRLSPFVAAVPLLRQVVLSTVLVVVTSSRLLLVLLIVGVFVFLVPAVVRTWFTRYTLDDEQLLVWTGALQRAVRVVSPARVQQVEVVRQLRHRTTDLALVRIELVGTSSSSNRVELDALTVAEAERVRDTLERGRRRLSAEERPADLPPPPPAPLLRVGTRHLVLGGLTGTPLLLVPFLIVSAVVEMAELIRQGTGSDAEPRGALAVVLVVGVVLAWPVVAGGWMVLRFHGYELARSGDDLIVQRGLLDTRTSVIPLPRVQLAHRSASVLRRWVGLASLDIRTASGEAEGSSSWMTTVPVGPADELEQLIPMSLGRATLDTTVAPHPAAARRRAVTRRLIGTATPIVGLIIVSLVATDAPRSVTAVLGVAGLAICWLVARAWGHAWYHQLGHHLRDDLLIERDGVLITHLRVVPVGRIQSVAVEQSPWQRRAGLCTARVHLAGGSTEVKVRDLALHDAVAIAETVRGLAAIDVAGWTDALSVRG
jgi:putative membrane protein